MVEKKITIPISGAISIAPMFIVCYELLCCNKRTF